jgi:predicted ATPase
MLKENLKKIISILNQMVSENIIEEYAIGGGVSAVLYARIDTFQNFDLINWGTLNNILIRHKLMTKWEAYHGS